MKEVVERMRSRTPLFFKRLRNVGLVLIAIGTTLVTAPVSLPAMVIQAAGYITVAGTIMSAVSQAAVEGE